MKTRTRNINFCASLLVLLAASASAASKDHRELLDDQEAWTGNVMDEGEQAVQIGVDIPPGTKKLTLTLGSDGPPSGTAAWANAGFLHGEGGPAKQ